MGTLKKQILCIAPLPPPVHGSAMMTQYIKDGKVINEAFDLDWINLSTSRKISEIGKKSPKKIFRFLNSYLKTLYKLSVKRYDLCYLAITCHGNGFLKDAPFALLCKLFGHKIVIHQHNKGMSKDVNKPLFRFLLKKVYKNAKVILLSERLYMDISDIVDRSQVVICPNGIPEVTRFPKMDNPIPRLLFLSNLIESKGVLVLLDVCKILKDRGYNFICNFIGNETKEIDKTRFRNEVENRGLNDYIFYLGPKYGEDKYKEIAGSDIFIFPTSYENECFPLVLLEALQQSVPIISTNEGGIPDIVKDNEIGVIVKSKDSDSLADGITQLLDNPDKLKRLGKNGYFKYLKQYTIKVFEETIIKCILSEK